MDSRQFNGNAAARMRDRPNLSDKRHWSSGSPTNLRARRERLGATVAMMATGIRLRPDVINDIENGMASGEAREHYIKWLSTMEHWSNEKRRSELFLAIQGYSFDA